MNEMVERVAAALWAVSDDPMQAPWPWSDCDPAQQAGYRKHARAAIRAMREPTYKIVRAMSESAATDDEGTFMPLCDLLDFSGENATHTVLKEAWRKAIDAALLGQSA